MANATHTNDGDKTMTSKRLEAKIRKLATDIVNSKEEAYKKVCDECNLSYDPAVDALFRVHEFFYGDERWIGVLTPVEFNYDMSTLDDWQEEAHRRGLHLELQHSGLIAICKE